MNSVLLDFGIFQIKWYSLFIFLAMVTGSFLVFQEAKKKKIPEDSLVNILFYGLILGILGARIYYVLFNLNYYFQNLIEIFMIWQGGLAIHGGILTGLVFMFFYCRKKNINLLLLLDVIVVGLIIAQSIGRWGNFFNGEAYGRTVSLEFLKNMHLPKFIIQGMYIGESYREPTFLYESILSFIGFFILMGIRRIPNLRVGQLTGTYLVWYGIERFFIEYFRSDALMIGPLRIAQIVSLLFILFGIYLLGKNIKNNRYYKEERLLLEK